MDFNAVAALPFLFLLGVSGFLVLFQFLAFCLGGGEHHHDVHHDIDVHHDVDISHDVDHDIDHHMEHHPGIVSKALGTVLVGTSVPIMVVMYILCLSTGLAGLAISLSLAKFFAVSNWFLALTLPASSTVGLLFTRTVVRKISPLFQISGKAETPEELVGKVGRVASSQIDHTFGEVVVEVNGVAEHIFAKTDGETIQRDDTIVVMDIDRENGRPIVTRVRN